MPRHRGVYKPENPEPYEVSRSRIEAFINCPACFWLDRVKGVKFPGMPPLLLNSATDTLLKKDFNKFRELQKPHPFMELNGLGHLVPFQYEDFETWTKSLQLGLKTYHEKSNLIIGGGLDDVWHDPKTNELFIVDYKSTAGKRTEDLSKLEPINLRGRYKEGYKRQMEMYQWILRAIMKEKDKDYEVSNTGYFVYVNGDQYFENGMLDEDPKKATMKFNVQLLEYNGDDSWVENTIKEISKCLKSSECPEHSMTGFGPKGDQPCEYKVFLDGHAKI
tara:strand:- start:2942 stop:3769 length:828 start_codon:yes stop_codon:yes gene_type:complete